MSAADAAWRGAHDAARPPVIALDPDSDRGRYVADALERELAEQLLEEAAAARVASQTA